MMTIIEFYQNEFQSQLGNLTNSGWGWIVFVIAIVFIVAFVFVIVFVFVFGLRRIGGFRFRWQPILGKLAANCVSLKWAEAFGNLPFANEQKRSQQAFQINIH